MTDELRVQHAIAAPVEAVFAAFTSHAGQVAFYGTDDPGWIVESHCDLRVGGRWTVTFGPSPEHLFRHSSVFEAIEPPRRLVLRTTESGPGRPTFSFSVVFLFEEREGRTLMTVIQSGFPTRELRDEHGRGVPSAFARLEGIIRPGPR